MSTNIKTASEASAELPPVVTRQDCYSWLSEDDVQTEVWAAFRGAVRWMDAEPFDVECPVKPGTVLSTENGEPVVDRGMFFDHVCEFIYWRLLRLAEKHGVRPYDSPAGPMGAAKTVAERIDAHPWAVYVGGEVQTFHFDSEREMKAFMKANGMSRKKKAPAGAANTPEAMTNFERNKADGTDCRT